MTTTYAPPLIVGMYAVAAARSTPSDWVWPATVALAVLVGYAFTPRTSIRDRNVSLGIVAIIILITAIAVSGGTRALVGTKWEIAKDDVAIIVLSESQCSPVSVALMNQAIRHTVHATGNSSTIVASTFDRTDAIWVVVIPETATVPPGASYALESALHDHARSDVVFLSRNHEVRAFRRSRREASIVECRTGGATCDTVDVFT